MAHLDPRLQFLYQQSTSQLAHLEDLHRFGVAAKEERPRARVLLQFTGDLESIEERGFQPTTVAGDVATGFVEIENLEAFLDLENVSFIECSRPMSSELNVSTAEALIKPLHAQDPSVRGAGVIVGLIDSGIDYTHACFRSADGNSRILAIWDQYLTPNAAERSPAGYNFGVEYNRAEINTALESANPFAVVRHTDGHPQGHGTHVAGIAAGNGSAQGSGAPAFTFVVVAPDADIILVANHAHTSAVNSGNVLDGVKYLLDKARELHRPIVINISQGDNLGPHDGTSLLERGIENLIGGPGQVVVKSAGNSANKNVHASGTIGGGGTAAIEFLVPSSDTTPDAIDIWYSGNDLFDVALRVPGGQLSQAVSPHGINVINIPTITLPNGNKAYINSVTGNPMNGDNQIYIQLLPGSAPEIEQGNWEIVLTGTTVVDGRFHAWVEVGTVFPRFTGQHADRECTITIPGTSGKIITVGAYVTQNIFSNSPVGGIGVYSGLGPTRDGRLKPDLAAPGEEIVSARAGANGFDQYRSLTGTSQAAPHVTGTVALLLEKDPLLTQADVKNILTNRARSDSSTGATPNNTWGFGKLHARASFDDA